MKQNRLKLFALVSLTCLIAAQILPWLAQSQTRMSMPMYGAILLSVLGIVLMLYLLIRFSNFTKKLQRLLRLLLSGKYEAALKPDTRWPDEITKIEEQLNQFTEQLRTYDTLRADRVRQSRLLIDALLADSATPLIIIDIERKTLRCNPVMQSMLKAAQPAIPMASISEAPANQPFLDMLDQTVNQDKHPQHGPLHLHLPTTDVHVDIQAKMVPIAARDGVVREVIVFGNLQPAHNTPQPDAT